MITILKLKVGKKTEINKLYMCIESNFKRIAASHLPGSDSNYHKFINYKYIHK